MTYTENAVELYYLFCVCVWHLAGEYFLFWACFRGNGSLSVCLSERGVSVMGMTGSGCDA